MKKVFLDELPRRAGYKNKPILWGESVGYVVKFIYDETEGEIEISGYNRDKLNLDVIYNGKSFTISIGNFVNCKFAIILGNYKIDYIYNVGDRILNDKRDIVIIDRKRTEYKNGIASQRVYKYKCNKCGFDGGKHYKNCVLIEELWVSEYSLVKGVGCSCCCHNSNTIVPGINDIPTTAPWIVEYFKGGYDEAKMYSKGSMRKVEFVCPNCGNKKTKSLNEMYGDKSLGCICGDKFSYPERFMYSVLKQLKVGFDVQLTRSRFEWCQNYRYDFYIPTLNMIIETHGEQHYKERTSKSKFKKSLLEEQENDRLKKELSLSNGIKHYIVLDCRKSDMEWIKKSILESKLKELFDLSKVDFVQADLYAIKSNKVKEICDYWNQKEEWETTGTIAKNNKWGIGASVTISSYLKKGAKLGWCDYDPKKESEKTRFKKGQYKKGGV